jgi:LacI family transcriptional regulator
MRPRITTTDIAREIGMHQTTVSLALRGDRRLKPETIARIKAAAEKLGYCPDPMLTALASYRRSRRPSTHHSVIAWVTNWPTRQGWRCRPMFTQFFDGARERATQLGYRLEEFWLNTGKFTPRRASDILYARGVQGLILAPQPDGITSVELDWKRFSVVTIGRTLRQPVLHMVSNDQFRTVTQLCHTLAQRGYRRIGYAIEKHRDERIDCHWSAAFDLFQRGLPPEQRTTRYEAAHDADTFRAWLLRNRPDVVFGCEEHTNELLQALRGSVPALPDFALIGITAKDGVFSGMNENAETVGATAVERLTALIHLGEIGIPVVPTRSLLDASWVDGGSTPRAAAGSARARRTAAPRATA